MLVVVLNGLYGWLRYLGAEHGQLLRSPLPLASIVAPLHSISGVGGVQNTNIPVATV